MRKTMRVAAARETGARFVPAARRPGGGPSVAPAAEVVANDASHPYMRAIPHAELASCLNEAFPVPAVPPVHRSAAA
jgi:hypothetical protein